MIADVMEQIKVFLRGKKLLRSSGSVGDDESLLDAGIIDSLAVLELAAFLEERFGIEVGEDDLVPENFDSFRAMSEFVRARLP